jgi:hypothetical protein
VFNGQIIARTGTDGFGVARPAMTAAGSKHTETAVRRLFPAPKNKAKEQPERLASPFRA